MARPRKRELRVLGPYEHGNRWRVVVAGPGGGGSARRTPRDFDTEEDAKEFIRRFERKLVGALSIDDAIGEYERHLKTAGIKAVSVDTTMNRVRGFFGTERVRPLNALTPASMRELYDKLRDRPKAGWVNPLAHEPAPKKIAVQTHQGMLSAAKKFLAWCVEERGYLRANPAAKVKPLGKPNRGKEQLRFDETRRLQEVCATELAKGDAAALAVLMASVLGLRASEVANMTVRDIDDGGRVVWVADSKTLAGRRTQETAWLAPWLGWYIEGRIGRLFPLRDRHWVRRNTMRLCRLAGVPETSVHGLRGTHATAAAEGGATAAQMMRGLGWAGPEVGPRHYIRPGATETARTRKAAARLMPAAIAGEGDE
jgi:integrase